MRLRSHHNQNRGAAQREADVDDDDNDDQDDDEDDEDFEDDEDAVKMSPRPRRQFVAYNMAPPPRREPRPAGNQSNVFRATEGRRVQPRRGAAANGAGRRRALRASILIWCPTRRPWRADVDSSGDETVGLRRRTLIWTCLRQTRWKKMQLRKLFLLFLSLLHFHSASNGSVTKSQTAPSAKTSRAVIKHSIVEADSATTIAFQPNNGGNVIQSAGLATLCHLQKI